MSAATKAVTIKRGRRKESKPMTQGEKEKEIYIYIKRGSRVRKRERELFFFTLRELCSQIRPCSHQAQQIEDRKELL